MSTEFTHIPRLLSREQGNPSAVLKDYSAHQKSDNNSFTLFCFYNALEHDSSMNLFKNA